MTKYNPFFEKSNVYLCVKRPLFIFFHILFHTFLILCEIRGISHNFVFCVKCLPKFSVGFLCRFLQTFFPKFTAEKTVKNTFCLSQCDDAILLLLLSLCSTFDLRLSSPCGLILIVILLLASVVKRPTIENITTVTFLTSSQWEASRKKQY